MTASSNAATARVISVQSAKGGVGKTLISTLIAAAAREDLDPGVPVILLDLDFAGTTLADTIETGSDGRGSLHGISIQVLAKPEPKGAFESLTVLELFEAFLDGCPVDRVFADAVNCILERSDYKETPRIILVPSGGPRDIPPAGGEKEKRKTFDTFRRVLWESVMVDENHANWFVDFLIELLDAGARLPQKNCLPVCDSDVGRTLFVLDNGPGISGLVSNIQRRLLRNVSHPLSFIHVASPDEMDLQASMSDLADLISDINKVAMSAAFIKQVADELRNKGQDTAGAEILWGTFCGDTYNNSDFDRTYDPLTVERFIDDAFAAGDNINETCRLIKRFHERSSNIDVSLIVNKISPPIKWNELDRAIVELESKFVPHRGSTSSSSPSMPIKKIGFKHSVALSFFFSTYLMQPNEPSDESVKPSVNPSGSNTTKDMHSDGALGGETSGRTMKRSIADLCRLDQSIAALQKGKILKLDLSQSRSGDFMSFCRAFCSSAGWRQA